MSVPCDVAGNAGVPDPGLLVIDDEDASSWPTRPLPAWLDELRDNGRWGRLPLLVTAVAERARAIASGHSDVAATARARTASGRLGPMNRNSRLELRVNATPAAVARLRSQVAAFAAAHDLGNPADVVLAVSDAVANVALHAYRDGDVGEVRVVACAYPSELVVVVRDYGCGSRPCAEPPP